jgi:hypothetical protein
MAVFNREEWLQKAVDELRPWFAKNGHPFKKNIYVSVGWPHDRDALGTTHTAASSSDKRNHVFIAPNVPRRKVLPVLAHEICHVVDDCQSEHDGDFQRIASAIGLVKPWTGSHASKRLSDYLRAIEEKIGPYKSPKLSVASVPTQSTRMLKIWCPKCKWTARAARRWIDAGLPTCTLCGVQFIEVKP